jgi:hypothetical protein
MDIREYPLLNTPGLMLCVLKVADKGEASLADALRHLRDLLGAARERPPVDEDELLRRLGAVRRYLGEAGLIDPADGAHFRITETGRRALAEHPAGFDVADLMRFEEFRRFVRRSARSAAPADPHTEAYDAGRDAYRTGAALSDNPYAPDTIDHLAWEDGWSEGHDEDLEGA